MNKCLYFNVEKSCMRKEKNKFRRSVAIYRKRKNTLAELYTRVFNFFLLFCFSPSTVCILGI